MNKRNAYIALNMMGKIGPVGVRSLCTALGSVEAIFDADESDLMRAQGVGQAQAQHICAQRGAIDWEAELARAEEFGARIVSFVDTDYPELLKQIHDPPLALYVKGRLESRDKHSIAIVGTRRPTLYGKACASSLAGQLAQAGFVVVSGLALGIDTAAHEGCLKASGRTLAVLGGALDCLTPTSNEGLAERIAASGAVLSEFSFGREPDKTTFPMRNRVVSGLSMGTLVVEAGCKSGALITASQAMEQGRSVFAVPGRIDTPGARGPHGLIRDGARLVQHVDDVLEEFECLIRPCAGERGRPEASKRPTLTDSEQLIVKILEEGEQNVDALIRRSAMTAAQVNCLLIGLEMKRVIKMMPGRMVELVR